MQELTVEQTSSETPRKDPSRFETELRWIAEHQEEYAGKWVALDGDVLLASGSSAREVYEVVDRLTGATIPLVVQIQPKNSLPFGGW